jgi:Uma2 family endonuclease
MASVTLIPVAEYLNTCYKPDREYIDGELRERNAGKWDHARIQWLLALWFGQHEREWNIIGSTEQRTRVSSTRIRIPDIVVLRPGTQQDVFTDPPLLVIEILSPDDTYSDTEERARDYWNMGVETMWIIDPKTRSGRMCFGSEWVRSARLEVPGTPIYVELEELFSQVPATTGIEPAAG